MSDILDDNEKLTDEAEVDDGMLIIFPDEDEDQEEVSADTEEDDGEAFSLSFGKVNAARKEEEFSYLPFLNIPEVVDEDEEDDDGDGESFSLSFGKVSAAKKERDYVYLPFLNVDENATEEEKDEDAEDEDDDSGIDVVGGDLFDLTPLKTKDSSKSRDSGSSKGQQNGKKQSSKKGKNVSSQKKKQSKNSITQKPNKVQQIISQIDPEILASVSADPRQMMMLEETIRSELIKQAAHNAVARELGTDSADARDFSQKRTQQGKQRPSNGRQKQSASGLSFSKQEMPRKNKTMIVDASTISEFGSEEPKPKPAVKNTVQPPAAPTTQQVVNAQPPASNNTAPPAAQPVIVSQTIPAPTVQQTASTPTQSTVRKTYTPTSPAAIRAAMKSGALSFENASSQSSDGGSDSSQNSAQSAHNRKRIELQKQLGEKRSGCVIGAIALLMAVFIAIIALISGGDIMTQCSYNESFTQAQTMYANGDYEGAIKILEGMKDYSQTASLLNECYYALGQKAQNEGDAETAISYYDKTIDYDAARRSRIEIQQNEAEKYYASAVKKNDIELYQKAYSLYAEALSEIESYPGILSDAELKEVQNKANSVRFDYAMLLYENGEYIEAKSHFENLMNSSYEEADTWYYSSRYNIGKLYFESDDYLSVVQELECFENNRYGLDDHTYANAAAYLALSRLYRIDEASDENSDDLQPLFSLCMKAHEGVEGELKSELEAGMRSKKFDEIKLTGFWKNDKGNYIVFENGEMSFYAANEINGGVAEVFSSEIKLNDGSVSVKYAGKSFVIMENISFESTYHMAPKTLTFVNPYDGKTYRMTRFR